MKAVGGGEAGTRSCVESLARGTWETWCPKVHATPYNPWPRSGAPWTVAEEQKLLSLYAEAFVKYPDKNVFSFAGDATPSKYVSRVLLRSPCACAGRFTQLRQCQKRMEAKSKRQP
jgi:hypothetical protein